MGCCCRFFTCIFTIIVALGVVTLVLYLLIRPSVDVATFVENASLDKFNLANKTLSYNLTVDLSIHNPNGKISIYYKTIEASAAYVGFRFGFDDNFPEIHQGFKNTTTIHPTFTGLQSVTDTSGSMVSTYKKEEGEGYFNIDVTVELTVKYTALSLETNTNRPEIKCSLKVPAPTSSGGGSEPFARTKLILYVNGMDVEGEEEYDYSKRSQWLRAAVLGANDGLVSTASLMMGVGAVRKDDKAMIMISGFAGLVAGACSMAIGEFVSVYSQHDIELAQLKRDHTRRLQAGNAAGAGIDRSQLPSPVQAAAASAVAFAVGAAVPLLAAGFLSGYKMRLGVVSFVATVALIAFGLVGAVLGKAPVVKSTVRVVGGGWVAMMVTFGMMKMVVLVSEYM